MIFNFLLNLDVGWNIFFLLPIIVSEIVGIHDLSELIVLANILTKIYHIFWARCVHCVLKPMGIRKGRTGELEVFCFSIHEPDKLNNKRVRIFIRKINVFP